MPKEHHNLPLTEFWIKMPVFQLRGIHTKSHPTFLSWMRLLDQIHDIKPDREN